MARVTVYARGWKGDHQVPFDESFILFVSHIEIDEQPISYTDCQIGWGSSGRAEDGTLVLVDDGDFAVLRLQGVPQSHRDRFSLDEVIEGTDDETLILPIGGIEFVEYPPRG